MQDLKQALAVISAMEARLGELKENVREKDEIINKRGSSRIILDSNAPISSRMRACFYLRTENTDHAAQVLAKVVQLKGDSVLLRHEAGYCLGQMKREIILPELMSVLEDKDDDAIVRHECAEALGAIGNEKCLDSLRRVAENDSEPIEVRETCDIAIDRFKDVQKGITVSAGEEDGFNTVDPAIVTESANQTPIPKLEEMLNSTSVSLYERYRAMFSLRNRAVYAKTTEERVNAVLAISRSLLNTQQGSLFRHEVAFVLGQLSHEASVPYLKQALEDLSLHDMVRHESAEALGGIGTEEALEILKDYLANQKEARIVRESCEVALDAAEYWKQFENRE